jgi:hypothetical protein
MKNTYFWKRGYRDKFYVPLQFIEPLVMFFDGLLNALFILTPYQFTIYSTYLRMLLKSQMKKRIEYEKTKNN